MTNTPRTVQDFIDNTMGLSLWCRDCQKGNMIPLEELGAAKGFELDLYQRPLPIICKHCRSRNLAYSVHGTGSLRARGGHRPPETKKPAAE